MIPDDFRAAVSIELHDVQAVISVDPKAAPHWRRESQGKGPYETSVRQPSALYAHVEAPHLLHLRILGRDKEGHEWVDDVTYSGSFSVWWG